MHHHPESPFGHPRGAIHGAVRALFGNDRRRGESDARGEEGEGESEFHLS